MSRKGPLYAYIFVFFFSLFAIFSNGHFGGDGLENYLTAESIVLDGDIAIHDRPFDVKEMKYDARGKQDASGRRYSGQGVGMPLLIAPLYAMGHAFSGIVPQIPHDYLTQFFVALFNPIMTALSVALLFALLVRMRFSPGTAFITTLCYGFCTMVPVYTRSGFSEPAVAFFALLAMVLLHRYEETGAVKYMFFCSASLGYSVLVKTGAMIFVPVFLCYVLYRTLSAKPDAVSSLKLWAAATLPVLVFCLAHFAIQTVVGSSLSIANAGSVGKVFSGTMPLKGLYYYLLSPGKGYFFYNVPLILGLFSVKRSFFAGDKVFRYSAVFILINILFYSYIFKRGSLFSWGPRYLYVTVPFMCIFLADFIKSAVSPWKKIILAGASLAGFLVQLPCFFINFSNYLFFIKEKMEIPEYLVNFMPDITPLKGSWRLFISALSRTFSGASLDFAYSPDYWFFKPVFVTMADYDGCDIWWVNAVKVAPLSLPAVIASMIFLAVMTVVSFSMLKKTILAVK